MNLNGLTIGLDYDGTCVTHEYPKIGRFIGAEPVLHRLVKSGARLILNTMRSDERLQDAVNWFKERNIPLYGINCNPTQKEWTNSPKIYANIYVDDAGLGCPLCKGLNGERDYVDWETVEKILFQD